MSNLPDDLQGNNPNYPWNEEEILQVCFYCEEAIEEDDHSEEILIEGFGWNHVHTHCKRK